MFIHKKKAVVAVLFGTTVLLMLLPLVVSFNEVLTQIVEQNVLYGWLQKNIVPIEAKMMGVLLMPFNYTYAYSPSNSLIVVNGITMSIT